jgi:E3 ubiquitin-protein ligase MGRN1
MGNRSSRQRPDTNPNTNQNESRLPQNSNYARYPVNPVPPPTTSYGHSGQYFHTGNAGAGSASRVPTWQNNGNRQQRSQQHAQSLTQTATIRNAVNLKKSSLKVIPSDVDCNFLRIEFEFDASEPCCAMTFVGVKEDASKGSNLVHVDGLFKDSELRVFPSAIEYDAGMQQRFPKDTMNLVNATQHGIDLGQIQEDCLLKLGDAGANDAVGFGLVIRLVTVTDKGRKEGFTLQDIVPGDSLKPWLQGQTTYASIMREADGWKVRVLKQKLWVDGVSYILQEIYGLENAASPSSQGTNEDHLCVICLTNRKDTTALPCRHMCMCHECADALRKQSSVCPICRNKVDSLLRIKLNTATSTV